MKQVEMSARCSDDGREMNRSVCVSGLSTATEYMRIHSPF